MSQSNGHNDVRQHARFELLEYAIVKRRGSKDHVRSVLIDVSLGGLQVRSRTEFKVGGSYRLNIGRVDSEPLEVDAEVRYSIPIENTDLYATGFRCLPATSTQRTQWVDYVHSIFQSQGESLVG